MQYQYTAEQQEFRDSLRRFVSDHYDYERHRQRLAKGEHFDAGLWQQWAELGVLGLALDEEYGGLGSGLDDMMAVAEELGRGLVPEPVVPVVSKPSHGLTPRFLSGRPVLLLPVLVTEITQRLRQVQLPPDMPWS